jgi:hypothetical protein
VVFRRLGRPPVEDVEPGPFAAACGVDRHADIVPVVPPADNDPKDLARIKQIVKTWIKNGVLTIEKRKDSNRKDREFVVPGSWSDAEVDPDPEEITLQ